MSAQRTIASLKSCGGLDLEKFSDYPEGSFTSEAWDLLEQLRELKSKFIRLDRGLPLTSALKEMARLASQNDWSYVHVSLEDDIKKKMKSVLRGMGCDFGFRLEFFKRSPAHKAVRNQRGGNSQRRHNTRRRHAAG